MLVAGIPIEFILFGIMLLGIAFFGHNSMYIAIAGLISILTVKLLFSEEFNFIDHISHEWHILLNLAGLLLGFAILTEYFIESKLPDVMPDYLPDDWRGGFMLLVIVALISCFLDNIAGAMIGAAIAVRVFNNKLHIGYIASLVAASNAGGAGSVLGSTTTTMMWIAGIPIETFFKAYIGSVVAIAISGVIASFQQDRYNRIQKDSTPGVVVKWNKIVVVLCILIGAITCNVLFDSPALGVWIVIILASFFVQTNWKELKKAVPGTLFLVALVFSASLMPVQYLPAPSWQSTFTFGWISSVFDNIPLIKITIDQKGYDWGLLAYAVAYGGSITWFGSSAGVAVCNEIPEAKSTIRWLLGGWHVALAYIAGFFALLWIGGWKVGA
ncbi:MAG: hypothetical protein NZ529_08405 [Cytophagaceae bacterium]|nr:hypothetical protein [Cytophagaceae bacterium]MDW8456804.1 hypothetical protein [Cytophagaceae bacterium]